MPNTDHPDRMSSSEKNLLAREIRDINMRSVPNNDRLPLHPADSKICGDVVRSELKKGAQSRIKLNFDARGSEDHCGRPSGFLGLTVYDLLPEKLRKEAERIEREWGELRDRVATKRRTEHREIIHMLARYREYPADMIRDRIAKFRSSTYKPYVTDADRRRVKSKLPAWLLVKNDDVWETFEL